MEEDDVLIQELTEIAEGEHFIPSLTIVDIAFNFKITSLSALARVHNLIQLSLISCPSLTVMEGLEASGHCLENVCITGCQLKSM